MANEKNFDLLIAHVDDQQEILTPTNILLKKRGILSVMLNHPSKLNDLKHGLDLILSDGDGIIEPVVEGRNLFYPDVPILIYSGNYSLIANYRLLNIPGVAKPSPIDYLAEVIRQYAKKN